MTYQGQDSRFSGDGDCNRLGSRAWAEHNPEAYSEEQEALGYILNFQEMLLRMPSRTVTAVQDYAELTACILETNNAGRKAFLLEVKVLDYDFSSEQLWFRPYTDLNLYPDEAFDYRSIRYVDESDIEFPQGYFQYLPFSELAEVLRQSFGQDPEVAALLAPPQL
jgi:hypothetical protein